MDDWQGRLTSVITGALRGDKNDLIASYRLLHGRESVLNMKGVLPKSFSEDVIQCLGPDPCLEEELLSQHKSVISPRFQMNVSLAWSLKGKKDVFTPHSSLPNNPREELALHVLTSLRKNVHVCTVEISDSVSSSLSSTTLGHSFGRSDIVQTLCYNPKHLRFHYPLVIQSHGPKFLGSLSMETNLCLWFVEAVFCLKEPSKAPAFYIAVHPCVLHTPQNYEKAAVHTIKDYSVRMKGKPSFATIDRSMRKVPFFIDNTEKGTTSAITSADCVSTTKGSPFFVLSRETGYPPRQG